MRTANDVSVYLGQLCLPDNCVGRTAVRVKSRAVD